MEELLNKLIKGWWKPRWESEPIYMLSSKKLYIPDTMEVNRSLRDLVSKESGLWQFCVKNKLVKEDCSSIELKIMSEWYWLLTDSSYQFWLMMCSLKDESELEQFLLDNIKI